MTAAEGQTELHDFPHDSASVARWSGECVLAVEIQDVEYSEKCASVAAAHELETLGRTLSTWLPAKRINGQPV